MQELLSYEGLKTKEVECSVNSKTSSQDEEPSNIITRPHETQTSILKRDLYY